MDSATEDAIAKKLLTAPELEVGLLGLWFPLFALPVVTAIGALALAASVASFASFKWIFLTFYAFGLACWIYNEFRWYKAVNELRLTHGVSEAEIAAILVERPEVALANKVPLIQRLVRRDPKAKDDLVARAERYEFRNAGSAASAPRYTCTACRREVDYETFRNAKAPFFTRCPHCGALLQA